MSESKHTHERLVSAVNNTDDLDVKMGLHCKLSEKNMRTRFVRTGPSNALICDISVAPAKILLQTRGMSLKYKLTVVLTLLISIFFIDQATKYWAVETLMGQAPRIYLGGFFQFVYAENPGAFLGLGGALSREVRFVFFALIVFLGLGGMLWYLFKKEKSRLNLFAYSFILAGGFGNLWDRVVHERGHVIDFMLMEVWGPIRTGVFNIADMAIVAGVLLALYGEIYLKKNQKKRAVIPATKKVY